MFGRVSFAALLATSALPGLSMASTSAASPAGSAVAGHPSAARPAVQFPLVAHLPAGLQLDPSILTGKPASGQPSHGAVTVMLELDATSPTVSLAQQGIRAGSKAGIAAVRSQRARVDALAGSVRGLLARPATAGTALFTLHNVYSGIAVRTDASRLGALAALPGVKAVHPMPVKHLLNSSTVPLVNAPASWGTGTGAGSDIGTGVTIGIIDTGIDYTHADFGGSGTVAAYKADRAVDDAPTLSVPSQDYPSAKVAGGWDFVGDKYSAASSASATTATPQGDPNPLDCDGHGTHVAGTAAGLGVTSTGATYAGPWSSTTSFGSLRIGPGVAPGAKLYALRVFGCSGDTNAVSKALDWAADPNGDGNFADRLDVVNMSLGTDYSAPDDPDAMAADALSLLGTTVVAAAGNGGDLQNIAGSPAAGNRAISVAASQDAATVYDALQVTAPAAVAGNVAGQENSAYAWADKAPVSADVVSLAPGFDAASAGSYTTASMAMTNADGCDPFTDAQKAAVGGKIVWLEWSDDDTLRRCSSADRSTYAAQAGAVGVILADDLDDFAAGVLGVDSIPTFEIRRTDAASLRHYVSSTLHVTLTHALHGSQKVDEPSLTDVVAAFSSRGSVDAGNLKPDLTAPGSTVFSAGVGSGSDGLSDSGTSMASPHVAGSAALVKAAHPSWTPEQIKAALVDTAVHDVWSDAAHTSREAPDRVGSGRLDAGAAVATQLLAYSAGDPGSVAVSFGASSYAKNTTVTQRVTVTNGSASEADLTLGFDWANAGTHPGGVTFGYPAGVRVPAGGSVTIPVTMTVSVGALTRTVDSAHDVDANGVTASFVTEASGWLTMTPVGGGRPPLRLSVIAAPRPASTMRAKGPLLFGRSATAKLALTGGGVRQDAGRYQSLVSGYELQLTSPRKPVCTAKLTNPSKCVGMASDRAGDLKYVGVTSDAPLHSNPALGMTYFAISAFGPWRSPTSYVEYDVFIDTSGDGKADAVLFNSRVTSTDVFVSELVSVKTDEVLGESVFALDNADGSVDSNLFNSDVMVLPLATSALTKMSTKARSGNITYWVAAGTIESGLTDVTKKASFNVLKPGLTVVHGPAPVGPTGAAFGGEQFFADLGKAWHVPSLTVHREPSYAAQHGKGLLLVHSDNVTGNRVQVVQIGKVATSVKSSVTAKVTPLVAGGWVTVTAKVTSARTGIGAPQGTVTFYDNGKAVLKRAVDHLGVVRLATRLTQGVHVIGARFSGNALDWLTSKSTVRVTVS
ncbi:MAG: hypothetical protein QOE76_1143 [Frankiales bacterium]|nr:hypothetical protein [Frankiales bacterium]